MATRSAAKAHRQSLKRRLRNRAVKSYTKTILKKAEAAIASGDPQAAREAVRAAIDRMHQALADLDAMVGIREASRSLARDEVIWETFERVAALLGLLDGPR